MWTHTFWLLRIQALYRRGTCHRRLLLDIFGEENTAPTATGASCEVCELCKPSLQQLYYAPDISALHQSCDDAHFVWKDIQLSKGQLNKDRLIKVEVKYKQEEVYFRSALCLGVKYCGSKDCSHAVPIRDKRNCPKHNVPLQNTTDCPVEFVYIHPRDGLGRLVRCQKTASDNLHNHQLHGANKIGQCVIERIGAAISANPTLNTN